MKDRRKPWQKDATAYLWSPCGTMLRETAKEWSAGRDASPAGEAEYARAMGIPIQQARQLIAKQKARLA